jgi:hypothetical protein
LTVAPTNTEGAEARLHKTSIGSRRPASSGRCVGIRMDKPSVFRHEMTDLEAESCRLLGLAVSVQRKSNNINVIGRFSKCVD